MIPRDTTGEALRRFDGAGLRALFTRVLDHRATGATCDELELLLGVSHQTASATLRDLQGRRGIQRAIVDSRARRPTRTGRPAIVWLSLRQAQRQHATTTLERE